MSADQFKVRVTKDHLVFCSGHFISYAGHQCERLHGHNYRAAVEVDGDLDDNHYLFDFIALKRETQKITDTLDHRMLLPTESHLIRVEESGPSVPYAAVLCPRNRSSRTGVRHMSRMKHSTGASKVSSVMA